MADDMTYAQHHSLARTQARAIIAAALIESKVVDLSGTFLTDSATAYQNPIVAKLKTTVDVIMQAVVQVL